VGEFAASLKMTAPRYQEVKSLEIPLITDDDGTQVRVICGSFWGKSGAGDGIAADPVYSGGIDRAGARENRCQWELRGMHLLTCLPAAVNFCNASDPLRCRRNRWAGWILHPPIGSG